MPLFHSPLQIVIVDVQPTSGWQSGTRRSSAWPGYLSDVRQRRRMIILKCQVWEEINGETTPTTFPNWPELLLSPLSFAFAGQDLVAVDYQV